MATTELVRSSSTDTTPDRGADRRGGDKRSARARLRRAGSMAEQEALIQAARRDPGRPLATSVRAPMEASLGLDLTSVRVYDGDGADALNRSLNSRAATIGQDIFFSRGAYDPGSTEGRELLAHEVTHTAQNRELGAGSGVQSKGGGNPDCAAEHEADAAARDMLAGKPVSVSAQPSAVIQCAGEYAGLGASQATQVDAIAEAEYYRKAEQFEDALGNHAARHVRATGAADDLVTRTQQLLQKWAQVHAANYDTLHRQAFGSKSTSSTGAAGDTAETIAEVIGGGNFREKMTLIYNAITHKGLMDGVQQRVMNKLLTDTMEQDGGAGSIAAAAGLDGHLNGADFDAARGRHKAITYNAARKETHHKDDGRDVDVTIREKAHASVRTDLTPNSLEAAGHVPLSYREMMVAFGVTPAKLDEWVQAKYAKPAAGASAAEKAAAIKDNRGDTKLKWKPGMGMSIIRPDTDFASKARKLGMSVGAAASGTTDMVMQVGKALNVRAEDTRLACLGWMLPARDHTFHEIMMAAAPYGCAYEQDEAHPGKGYETVAPLGTPALTGLLAENKLPRFYLSDGYKDLIAGKLFPSVVVDAMDRDQALRDLGSTPELTAKPVRSDAELTRLLAEALPRSIVERLSRAGVGHLETVIDTVRVPVTPAEAVWHAYYSEAQARWYYHDTSAGVSTWAAPADAWICAHRDTGLQLYNSADSTVKAGGDNLATIKGTVAYRAVRHELGSSRTDLVMAVLQSRHRPGQLTVADGHLVQAADCLRPGLKDRVKPADYAAVRALAQYQEPGVGDEGMAHTRDIVTDNIARFTRLDEHVLDTLTDEERFGIHRYTTDDYKAMNPAMSRLTTDDVARGLPRNIAKIKMATAGLEKLPVYNGTVYRGEVKGALDDPKKQTYLRRYKPGEVITHNKLLSTAKSLGSDYLTDNDLKVHFVMEGIKTGRDVQLLSEFDGEEEVLFAPGARFVVSRVHDRTDRGNGLVIYMKEV